MKTSCIWCSQVVFARGGEIIQHCQRKAAEIFLLSGLHVGEFDCRIDFE
jgi:hypothetical protein